MCLEGGLLMMRGDDAYSVDSTQTEPELVSRGQRQVSPQGRIEEIVCRHERGQGRALQGRRGA